MWNEEAVRCGGGVARGQDTLGQVRASSHETVTPSGVSTFSQRPPQGPGTHRQEGLSPTQMQWEIRNGDSAGVRSRVTSTPRGEFDRESIPR